jgi:Family of unknown function (DUF6519)
MQGDFSRTTFDPRKHFSAVLTQQGRVQLDSDGNEEAAILLRYLRQLAADVIGPAGYPPEAPGFAIDLAEDDLTVSPGRLYVDGILAENDLTEASYFTQPDGYLDKEEEKLPESGQFLVYLRVWERLVTAVQDPSIREVALGDLAPDTSARSQVVWQVAHFPLPAETSDPVQAWRQWLTDLHEPRGTLRARAGNPDDADDDEPCVLPPGSRYRGESNQLYRVEIHRSGSQGEATFKWSRENASVVFPIVSLSGDQVEVSSLGRDGKLGLVAGDLVELVDNAQAARVADDVPPDTVPELRRVVAVDPTHRLVTLDSVHGGDETGTDPRRTPFLRRWDHQPPAEPTPTTRDRKAHHHNRRRTTIPVTDNWTLLEDGIYVQFDGPHFRRGDHWLIPARTTTGDVVWPTNGNGPAPREPDGVDYHYTPLAIVDAGNSVTDLRLPITHNAQPPRRSSSRRGSGS